MSTINDYNSAFALKMQGNAAFDSKDYQTALKFYSKIIIHLGMNGSINLSQVTTESGGSNPYDPSLRTTIQKKIDDLRIIAFNNMAAVYLKMNKYENVIENTSRILQVDPLNIKALFRRAIAYRKMGKFDDAHRDLSNAAITSKNTVIQKELDFLIQRNNLLKKDLCPWQSTTITVKMLSSTSTPKLVQTCQLHDVKPEQTVLDLKLKLQCVMRIYHETQKLLYAGKGLQNNVMLRDLNITAGTTMYLVLTSQYVHTFNNLLCDDEISVVHKSMDELYTKMMTHWRASNCLENAPLHLRVEHVYKIEKNFEQNMKIYEALVNTKRFKGNQNEDILFHGTSAENIKKIINTGFNRDYNIKSQYGKGTYFSNQARIAARYCTKINNKNMFTMLACKTYIGESTRGRLIMRNSEFYKEDKVTQYDSLVNDLDNPSIFVINRDYHSVPCFIIMFTFRKNAKK